VIDARERFKKEVVEYFLDEYRSGRTPNPCVFCNEKLKFKILFEEARRIRADWVATGHYARLRREISNDKYQITNPLSGRADKFQASNSKPKTKLFKAADETKDQSYFLYRLKQEQLRKLIFPLGEYKKSEVKKMARELGFASAERRETQNVCFLLDEDVSSFLKENLALEKGDIVDQNGLILGTHEGLPLYTIGQRKGVRIGGTGPYYVSGKDFSRNVLFVTNSPGDIKLERKEIILREVSFLSRKTKLSFRALVATRYQQKEIYATIFKRGVEYSIRFEKSQRFVAPGQSAVFYSKKGEVLGGGIIG
jgi:tRNA-specific 2-thiouridylase